MKIIYHSQFVLRDWMGCVGYPVVRHNSVVLCYELTYKVLKSDILPALLKKNPMSCKYTCEHVMQDYHGLKDKEFLFV